MSKISSKDCKDAILKFAYENKEYCESLFSYDFLVSPLYEIKNWKRIHKEKIIILQLEHLIVNLMMTKYVHMLQTMV